MAVYELQSEKLRARITSRGAELLSLLPACGQEMLWQRDSAWWDYTAPILFPIIGRPVGIRISAGLRPMNSHGFARERVFKLVESAHSSLTLTLESCAETESMYPFKFRLSVRYRIWQNTIEQEVVVKNTGTNLMPASFGFHPALSWPAGPTSKLQYRLALNRAESGPFYRVSQSGVMQPAGDLPDLRCRVITLENEFFKDGALVINDLQSTEVLLSNGVDPPFAHIRWSGCRQLGLWSLPGASFMCVEPWHGHPSPFDFYGELLAKPGAFLLAQGQERFFKMSITVLESYI